MSQGIFGQVPQNGGYVAQHGPSGVLGQWGFLPPTTTLYLDPPTYNNGGIRTIEPSSKPAFVWSINSTTVWDMNLGASQTVLPEWVDTHVIEVVAGPGDDWLSTLLLEGYAVLYMGAPIEGASNTLSFVATKDPRFVAEHAPASESFMVLIDGPPPIVEAAKALASGEPPPAGPPVPPAGPPVPPSIPEIPVPLPAPQCKPGEMALAVPGRPDLPSVCVPDPYAKPTPGLPTPPGTQPVQPAKPAPNGAPATTDKPAEAAAKAPDWVLPVLIAVVGVSMFVIVARATKG